VGKSVTTNNLADYTAKAVATLLREMPELDMLGFRIGESGQEENFYQKAYLKGTDRIKHRSSIERVVGRFS